MNSSGRRRIITSTLVTLGLICTLAVCIRGISTSCISYLRTVAFSKAIRSSIKSASVEDDGKVVVIGEISYDRKRASILQYLIPDEVGVLEGALWWAPIGNRQTRFRLSDDQYVSVKEFRVTPARRGKGFVVLGQNQTLSGTLVLMPEQEVSGNYAKGVAKEVYLATTLSVFDKQITKATTREFMTPLAARIPIGQITAPLRNSPVIYNRYQAISGPHY